MRKLNQQYIGYINTEVLWNGENSWGIRQFKMPKSTSTPFESSMDNRIRLGKLVERFVSFELNLHDDIQILVENIQIQKDRRTLGELDCILKQGTQYIHLEIVYKFYLYDPDVGTTEFDHWIGPNRKDCLVDKLTKLKDKQLPLLYHPETLKYLEDLNITSEVIVQQVYFKAQLFVPYHLNTDPFKAINPHCIKGFYVAFSALSQFETCKFYIPEKLDWLSDIEIQTPWLDFYEFKTQVKRYIDDKKAPLCWIKNPNGLTEKCFVVWW